MRICLIEAQRHIAREYTEAFERYGLEVASKRSLRGATGLSVDLFVVDVDAVASTDLIWFLERVGRRVPVVLARQPIGPQLVQVMRSVANAGVVVPDEHGDGIVAVLTRSTTPGNHPGNHDAEPNTTQLSPRERQVLQQIAQGRTHRQIARALDISEHTVDTYVKRVRSKLGAGNKAQLTRIALSGE
ncbi:helix-turn-helix transcriptional regulator [Virgisporangium aurantiacum]|uniref:HTH luxR-type domain-containing protein n=1 Tax=Virgisporangium aurantiacum TaxID=175570 RepID=A0A8J3ZDZ3_9ACTN|nr:LuxR C-terminal-related transcriptional regulator [Virgisporangium aurantiacum]GIJ62204.1 hypothetical protein Vau01_097200 [Virgisporangium aurantiacum]